MAGIPAGKRLVKKTLFALGFELRRIRTPTGAKGYSYCDEEAIIQELLGKLSDPLQFAIDIGAGDGIYMSNSYRLFSLGWKGIAMELDGRQFAQLASRYMGLTGVSLLRVCVTPDNVLNLLASCGTPKNFGYFGLDIDSYDYFVLEKVLSTYRPSLICTEINEKIPPPLRFAVKWQPNGTCGQNHFYGQSLSMLEALATRHNYDLVRLEYNNAFLIPREINPVPALSASDAWRKGYVERPDRQKRFPWNADMEHLIAKSADESRTILREKFKQYDGKYILE